MNCILIKTKIKFSQLSDLKFLFLVCIMLASSVSVNAQTNTDTLIPQTQMKVVSVISNDKTGTKVLDGNSKSFWGAWGEQRPHEMVMYLGDTYEVSGFRYLPYKWTKCKDYAIYLSTENNNWGTPVAYGRWANDATEKEVRFTPKKAQFIKIKYFDNYCYVAEHNVLGKKITNTDIIPPSISITSPVSNATIAETISINTTVQDNIGVAGVQFYLDDIPLGVEDTTIPYSINWNTLLDENGRHTIKAIAKDLTGNTSSAAISVIVENKKETTIGKTYYVASNGSDYNPGTEALPFKTLQHTISVLKGGETVFIRQGIHAAFRIVNLHPPADQWITFKSYPGEQAVIDSAGPIGSGIRISGASYLIFENLEITQSNYRYNFTCDLLKDPSCLTIAKQLTNSGRRGISIDSTYFGNANTDTHHIIIRNNNIHHNGLTAILAGTGADPINDPDGLGNYDFQIINNHIHHNGVDRVTEGYGTYISGTNHLIKGNIVHDNTGQGIRLGNTSQNNHLVNSIVENNISYNNKGPFYHKSSDSISTTAGMGIVVWGGRGNIIRNNILYGNYGGGIQALSLDEQNPDKVYNNTSYNNGTYGLLLQKFAIASNNITHNNARRIPAFEITLYNKSQAFNNLVGENRFNLFIKTLDDSDEQDNMLGFNPMFIDEKNNNCKLNKMSPAVDTGIDLKEVLLDFENNPRPLGRNHDMGAYEWVK